MKTASGARGADFKRGGVSPLTPRPPGNIFPALAHIVGTLRRSDSGFDSPPHTNSQTLREATHAGRNQIRQERQEGERHELFAASAGRHFAGGGAERRSD